MIDEKYTNLMKELKDAKALLSKFEEKERLGLIENIRKFGNQYSVEELSQKDNQTLEIIEDSLMRLNLHPSYTKYTERDEAENLEDDKEAPSFDPAHLFDSVLKDFDMSNIKTKSGK